LIDPVPGNFHIFYFATCIIREGRELSSVSFSTCTLAFGRKHSSRFVGDFPVFIRSSESSFNYAPPYTVEVISGSGLTANRFIIIIIIIIFLSICSAPIIHAEHRCIPRVTH